MKFCHFSTCPAMNFINLAGEAQDFELAKWISTGQIYPTHPLEAMRAYYDTIYDIPSECQNRLLPNNSISNKFGCYSPFHFLEIWQQKWKTWMGSICNVDCSSLKHWCAALSAGVQKTIPNLSWVSWIPSNQKIHPYWKLVLSLHTFKPAKACTRRNLTVIRPRLYIFGLVDVS